MSIKKSPQIRFKGFIDDWEYREIGQEFYKVNERNDGSFGKEHWISVAKMYFQDPEKVTSNNIDTRTYIMRKGDIAFEGNKSKQFKYGRFVANDIGDGVVSELFPIYRHKGEYNNSFWKRAIHLEKIMGPIFAKSITSSGTSSNKLDEKHFLRQFISIPELSEQNKIGSFFDSIDSLISLHQRKLELLKDTKKSMLQKMFPKEGTTVPEIRFAGFTDDWEERKYSEVIDLLSGQDFNPNEYNDEEKGIPYLTGASCIEDGHTIAIRWTEKPRCIVEQGDTVLVCKGSGYGAIATVDQEKAHIARQFMALKVKKSLLDVQFNYWLLNSVVENIKMDARGLIAGIARDAVLQQDVVIPTIEEQAKIGTYFKNFDNFITSQQQELHSLKKLKKSMLQKMFI